MARRAAPKKERDIDYTVPGLIALVGVVVFTALFFAQDGNLAYMASTDANVAGQAGYWVDSKETVDVDAPAGCEITSYCDGTKLVRQREDCKQYFAFCQYGCEVRDEQAVCL